MKRIKLFLLLPVFFNCFSGATQQNRWKAPVQPPAGTGFHQVEIPAQFKSHLNIDFSDLRLLDENGDQVPFIFQKRLQGNVFRELPLIQVSSDTSVTSLVVDARSITATDHLNLLLANTSVSRTATLSGSYDGRQWYIIDNIILNQATGHADGHFIQAVNFPLSRYPFLRLQIRNNGSDPLNILGAGIFPESGDDPVEPEIYPAVFNVRDSSGQTLIRILPEEPWPADRLKLQISGPPFFRREVSLFAVEADGRRLLGKFEIFSGAESLFRFQRIKARELLAIIHNGDNPPLNISHISVMGEKTLVTAWMEAGRNYFLAGGNEDAVLPRYDLALFRDSIPDELPLLTAGNLLPAESSPGASAPPSFAWIWIPILLCMAVLGYIVLRLITEMKAQRNENRSA